MRLLIADRLPEAHVQKLKKIADDVEYEPGLTREMLTQRVARANILVVRSTEVGADTLEQANDLELIVRAGAGTENIHLEAATARGIYVANCPHKNAAAVAELTIGLLLAVDRRIPQQTVGLVKREWDKTGLSKADGLKGKTFGVIEASNLASALSLIFAPTLAKWLGALRMIVTTRLVGVALLISMPMMPFLTMAAIVYVVRGVFVSVGMPIRQSYMMGVVDRDSRATAVGVTSGVGWGFPYAVSPVVSGFGWRN